MYTSNPSEVTWSSEKKNEQKKKNKQIKRDTNIIYENSVYGRKIKSISCILSMFLSFRFSFDEEQKTPFSFQHSMRPLKWIHLLNGTV